MAESKIQRLGIIAGQGQFPLVLAREAGRLGVEIIAVAINGLTAKNIGEYAQQVHWFELGEISRVLQFLKDNQIREVALAGRVPHSMLLHYPGFDKFSTRILSLLTDKKANSVLSMVSTVLERNGITVVDTSRYLKSYIPQKGLLTPNRPLTAEEEKEVKFGLPLAQQIAALDIGLTIVVKNQIVVAVESIEGTDQTIRRAAEYGGKNVVVIKVARPKQDPRWDLPVIGLNTIKTMAEVKAAALAISANKTLFFDRQEAVSLAEQANIAIVAI